MRSRFRRFLPADRSSPRCTSGGSPPSGALTITVTGLPSGPAAIMVTGPNSFSHAVTATTTLSNLPAGTYTVTASNVMIGTATYTPSPTTTGVSITTSTLNAAVTYTLSTGGLALTVSGLPGGVNGNVLVTGPGDSARRHRVAHVDRPHAGFVRHHGERRNERLDHLRRHAATQTVVVPLPRMRPPPKRIR